MFDHILVTTDGSPLSHLALPVAADLACKYRSKLTLLYVVPRFLPQVEGVAYPSHSSEEQDLLLAEGKRILEAARRILDYPGTEVVWREQQDLKTERVIAQEVDRCGARLVVMSTHGRSGLAHLFMGSVAESVMRQVSVPVLLIQAPGRNAWNAVNDPQEAMV
ncbi:universal stress protein [Deinococcus detaillensis]|uniref:Universal stress protein n=1 Tax=Deinococcus detaillensis TaxID=2592048 RepID=A0A553UFS9_9DEIO|nr:universal stress protein [Deinococcus detaillensis]TSA79065.1 universal stress protein [Deinococcus detaillensis]